MPNRRRLSGKIRADAETACDVERCTPCRSGRLRRTGVNTMYEGSCDPRFVKGARATAAVLLQAVKGIRKNYRGQTQAVNRVHPCGRSARTPQIWCGFTCRSVAILRQLGRASKATPYLTEPWAGTAEHSKPNSDGRPRLLASSPRCRAVTQHLRHLCIRNRRRSNLISLQIAAKVKKI